MFNQICWQKPFSFGAFLFLSLPDCNHQLFPSVMIIVYTILTQLLMLDQYLPHGTKLIVYNERIALICFYCARKSRICGICLLYSLPLLIPQTALPCFSLISSHPFLNMEGLHSEDLSHFMKTNTDVIVREKYVCLLCE